MNSTIVGKLTRFFVIIVFCLFGFLSGGCANDQQQFLPQQPKQQTSEPGYVVKSYQLLPFSKVVASGNFILHLTDSSSDSSLIAVGGQEQDIDDLDIRVANNTLYLDNASIGSRWRWCRCCSSSAINTPPVVIKLGVGGLALESVVARGLVCVFSKNIIAKNLSITAYDKAAFMLDGRLSISKITQMGSGKLEAKWIDSKNLTVLNSGKGAVYLAGIADRLAVTLTNRASFDARYLRAKRAAIFATDTASANVLALKSLEIYADKHSSVFYYKRPKQSSVVTNNFANALLIKE